MNPTSYHNDKYKHHNSLVPFFKYNDRYTCYNGTKVREAFFTQQLLFRSHRPFTNVESCTRRGLYNVTIIDYTVQQDCALCSTRSSLMNEPFMRLSSRITMKYRASRAANEVPRHLIAKRLYSNSA